MGKITRALADRLTILLVKKRFARTHTFVHHKYRIMETILWSYHARTVFAPVSLSRSADVTSAIALAASPLSCVCWFDARERYYPFLTKRIWKFGSRNALHTLAKAKNAKKKRKTKKHNTRIDNSVRLARSETRANVANCMHSKYQVLFDDANDFFFLFLLW